jgi:hypothetical protein
LTTWKDAPNGKIQKFDVSVAKNYLTESEMAQLQRLVSAYLDVAEDMALRQIPMTMQDWETRLNRFIAATDREILQDAGKVTAESLKPTPKVSLRNTASSRTGCSSRISTGCSRTCRRKETSHEPDRSHG